MTPCSTERVVPAVPQDDPTIWQVDDVLWAHLAPLLVVDKPRKKPGRPRADDRPLFNGVLWVLRTGAQWKEMPPQFGPKSTVHQRFQEWVYSGAFARAWALVLAEYEAFVGLELHWQSADGCLVKAPLGKKGVPARLTGQGPTPRIAANAAPNAIC